MLVAWLKFPKMGDRYYENGAPFRFYCIKHNLIYVGIIEDKKSDLHWFIKPNYRRKGIMKGALHNTILPYIFTFREHQHISIDPHYLNERELYASKGLATSLGFKISHFDAHGVPWYIAQSDELKRHFKFTMQPNKCTVERANALENEFNYLISRIHMIEIEVESINGNRTLISKLAVIRNLRRSIETIIRNLPYE